MAAWYGDQAALFTSITSGGGIKHNQPETSVKQCRAFHPSLDWIEWELRRILLLRSLPRFGKALRGALRNSYSGCPSRV